MDMDDDVLQQERVDIQSPKRKVIRVESEETQDCVRETLAISHEEAEEMAPCQAPLMNQEDPLIGCDNRSSEKAIRYWQIALKPTPSTCVSSATMRSWCSKTNSH